MANLIRSAKSSSDWTDDELEAYDITFLSLPPDEFFPNPDPSLDHIDPVILKSPPGDTNPTLSSAAFRYLSYLNCTIKSTEDFLAETFAFETLKLLDFEWYPAIVHSHRAFPLAICGEANHVTHVDVCLVHNLSFILIEGKTLASGADAKAQVFQFNNRIRISRGLNPLDSMIIPCFSMTKTRPTFYLVPVTTALDNAVITGQYPATQTRVLQCVIEPHVLHITNGMEDVEYRKLALKRLLAFKTLAKSYWVHFLEGV